MKDHPILFNGAMVRAILDGRKTMTRRVLKPQPKDEYSNGKWCCDRYNYSEWWNFWGKKGTDVVNKVGLPQFKCPYGGQPGDRLWIKESGWLSPCREFWAYDATPGIAMQWSAGMITADNWTEADFKEVQRTYKHKPSIFMPRWASRITLEITSVRVERLQEIDAIDAKWEGCSFHQGSRDKQQSMNEEILDEFHALWDSINGKKHPWGSNPWVWVIEFKKL